MVISYEKQYSRVSEAVSCCRNTRAASDAESPTVDRNCASCRWHIELSRQSLCQLFLHQNANRILWCWIQMRVEICFWKLFQFCNITTTCPAVPRLWAYQWERHQSVRSSNSIILAQQRPRGQLEHFRCYEHLTHLTFVFHENLSAQHPDSWL